MKRFHDSERGAALVEMAAVIGLLMLIAIGAFEWGMAFRDSISVSTAAREGARVASSAGQDPDADCFIIEAAAGALQAISGNKVVELWIYESSTGGTVGSAISRPRSSANTRNRSTAPDSTCGRTDRSNSPTVQAGARKVRLLTATPLSRAASRKWP